MILNELSLRIEAGGHYAFVGVNGGAGKTTIIKLLTGLYDNYSGEILLNGVELRHYSLSELKSFFLMFCIRISAAISFLWVKTLPSVMCDAGLTESESRKWRHNLP